MSVVDGGAAANLEQETSAAAAVGYTPPMNTATTAQEQMNIDTAQTPLCDAVASVTMNGHATGARPKERSGEKTASTNQANAANPARTGRVLPSQDMRCVCCNGDDGHPLAACNEFMAWSFQTRVLFVQAERLCTRCIRMHTGECHMGKCKKCVGRSDDFHSPLLCPIQENRYARFRQQIQDAQNLVQQLNRRGYAVVLRQLADASRAQEESQSKLQSVVVQPPPRVEVNPTVNNQLQGTSRDRSYSPMAMVRRDMRRREDESHQRSEQRSSSPRGHAMRSRESRDYEMDHQPSQRRRYESPMRRASPMSVRDYDHKDYYYRREESPYRRRRDSPSPDGRRYMAHSGSRRWRREAMSPISTANNRREVSPPGAAHYGHYHRKSVSPRRERWSYRETEYRDEAYRHRH